MFDVVVSAYCVFLLQKKIALLSFALLAFHWDISRFRNHTDAFVLADGHGHLTAHRVAHAVHRRSTSLSTGPRSSTTSAPRSTHPLGAKTTPPGRPPLTPTPPSSSARPLEARKCALPPAVKRVRKIWRSGVGNASSCCLRLENCCGAYFWDTLLFEFWSVMVDCLTTMLEKTFSFCFFPVK